MKILALTMAGFGPYKNEQHVDFEQFDDDGIFLITGKTGAGKSSILDAICYALYNGVPRYEGTQQQLRSDHCDIDDPTFVELDFRINGTDYRVRRTPEFERPKRRGSGTTKQAASAELFVRDGDGWRGLAARAVDVAMELDGVLGLSKDQFLQVILLAQNRFQKFLRSGNDDRQAVLRTLFGTRRFEQVETALVERRKALETRLGSSRDALAAHAAHVAGVLQMEAPAADPTLEWFEETLAGHEVLIAAAETAAQFADAAALAAVAHLHAVEEAKALQARRDGARRQLADWEAQREGVAQDRLVLDAATRASIVQPQITRRAEAAASLEAATDREAVARERYAELGDPDAASAELTSLVDDAKAEQGALQAVLADEARLPSLQRDVASAAEQVAACVDAIEVAVASAAELPTRIESETQLFLDAQGRAAAEPSAAERVASVVASLTSATRAVPLESEHRAALERERSANAALTAAVAEHGALLSRRLAGYASELASELVDGAPCAVCGSVDHPVPASPTDDQPHVTDADLDAANAAITEASATLRLASDATAAVALRLAEERAASGGKGVPQLEGELAEAESALGAAQAARTEMTARQRKLTALRAELEGANATLERLRDERATAEKRQAELTVSLTDIDARVQQARGDYGSVTERAAALAQRISAATAVIEAAGQVDACRAALEGAEAVLAAQFAEHGFATADEVDQARRSRVEIQVLEARIRAYEQGVATASATLRELADSDLPDEPIGTDAAREAAATAAAARDDARDARASLAERASQLRSTVEAARAQYAASAGLQEEYAQLRELTNAVQGLEPNTKRMRLETYVLAAQLEEIVAAANARLGAMTHGRFALEHDDAVQYRNTRSGLGLAILDQHTGRSRATHSLSGGETFLASLALALGLAEVVQNQAGGITLDTLFIDEGFGSLDSETLETAMATLDGLRAGGRTIGLISHVDTMKEQIHAKLHIRVTDQGHSEITAARELPAIPVAPLGPLADPAPAVAQQPDLVGAAAP
ncbi:AAA family ATPase [Planctomonas deserti]|uniref:AAA family ATPase n=1 Tax=Planctomonas deserti TaxID=2144185 RepID=UPI000D35EA07|nr:SMC family ATPase [Planctomonas deserti]